MDLKVEWLGRMRYREPGTCSAPRQPPATPVKSPDTLLLVEHEPVLTLGRHARDEHVIACPTSSSDAASRSSASSAAARSPTTARASWWPTPSCACASCRSCCGPFVRALELAMADVAARYGVAAAPRPGYPGVWIDRDGPTPRKLGALGLRVERGITYHGIALNITTRLEDFELIDPCGMAGLDVTSIARELGWQGAAAEPPTDGVARRPAHWFAAGLRQRLDEAVTESGRAARRRPARRPRHAAV